MSPLADVLQPLVSLLNRQIGESTPARELAARLDERIIAVRVRDSALALALRVDSELLRLVDAGDEDPDVVVCGSLLALGRLAGAGGEALIRDGTVELTGDATVAEDFRALLRHARPDWEEELSGIVGDAAAHGIGNALRGLARWGNDTRNTLRQDVGEYLQEESRALPGRYEVRAFRERVQALRDDVERAAARLARLERAAGEDGDEPARPA